MALLSQKEINTMKTIQFIKTVSPQKQHLIQQWLMRSLIFMLGNGIVIGWLYAQQAHALNKLKKEKSSLIHYAQKHESAQADKIINTKTKKECEQKADKIKRHLHNPKNPHALIESLIALTTKNNIAIESIALQKHDLLLRVSCPHADQLVTFMNGLKELAPLHNSSLVSVEKKAVDTNSEKSTLICTLTSDIKK